MTVLGTMRALDSTRGAVRVEDVYDTDIDDLWTACTTPDRLARWIAEVSGDLRVGGNNVNRRERSFAHLAAIAFDLRAGLFHRINLHLQISQREG